MRMSLTVRTLVWFLIISAATSLVFEAWRRTPSKLRASHNSDDPGDPSSLVTYRGSHFGVNYRALDSVRTSWSVSDGESGVSAVILNWSRFQNVVLIVSGLCSPSLKEVISEIIVWNNSPRKISAAVSVRANCFTTKYAILTERGC